jgi:peptidoglycan-associated lipoprotein
MKKLTLFTSLSPRAMLLASTLLLTGVACTNDEAQVKDVITAELPSTVKNQNNKFSINKNGKVKFDAEIVYFKFDDHTLTPQGQSRLAALADYMSTNPKKALKVQGHCDERGSTEYNLALGQNRSQTVRKYLLNLGVNPAKISAISFGEEKPAASGHSEQAWSKNRRADFQLTDS